VTGGRGSWIVAAALVSAVTVAGCAGQQLPRIVVLHDPLLPEDHLALGVAYEREGQPALARTEYETVLRRRPEHVTAMVNLGNLAAAEGSRRGAEGWYRRAIRIGGPEAAPAANNLAWLYSTQGKRLSEAVSLARQAIAWDPRPAFFDTWITILLASGNPLEASRAIDEAESQLSDDLAVNGKAPLFADQKRAVAELAGSRGNALLVDGRLDAAEPLLREAARRNPDRAPFHMGALAEAFLLVERVDDAKHVMDEAEARSAGTETLAETKRELAAVAHSQGKALLQDGRLASAEALVREAVHWDPPRAAHYLDTLAQVLIAQDKPYEAGAVIDEAEALVPNGDAALRARLYDRKAELFASRGLAAEAKAAAQQADALRKVGTP